MHATAEAAKIRGGATYLAYRQGPLFLFPCLRVHLYNPLLPLAHLGFLSRRARPTLRTPSTAPAARRSSSPKGHRDTGNELQSVDRLSLTRSFGHRVSGSKEQGASCTAPGKIDRRFRSWSRSRGGQTEEEFAPPARPAPARWRTEQAQCASKTRKNALGISRKEGGDTVHLD